MKRKLLLFAVTLLCAVFASAYTTSDLTTAGWTKITTISQNDISGNYYIFLSQDESLILKLEASSNQGNNAAFFRELADPSTDEAMMWTLEKNGSNYCMRNVGTSILQMQTEYSASSDDLRWRTNDQKFPVEWTGLSLSYSDSYWTLTSTEYSRPLGIYNNVTGSPAAGKEVGANDAGNGQKFNIYVMSQAAYSTKYAPTATSSNPVNVTSYITNPEISQGSSKTVMPTGWSEDISIRSAGNNNRTAAANAYTWLEGWTGSTNDNSLKVKYYQTISTIPNGKYIVKAVAGDSNGTGGGKIYISNGTDEETVSMTTAEAEISTNAVLTTNGSITIGMTAQGKDSWVHATNFHLYYLGNAVAYYSPASFTNNTSATANKWYYFSISTAGYYKITSTAEATIRYTQNSSDDADTGGSTKELSAGGHTYISLSQGSFYFKSSVASTITIAALTDGEDLTFMLNNAAVASTTGWANGRTSTGQQYTDAPDNTYMDTWNGTRDQNQSVSLPAGYYLLKVATRADASLSNGYVYASVNSANIGSADIHKEGSTGNLLGNGWAWTRFGFQAAESASVQIGFYSECGGEKWAGADDFHLYYYATELAMKQAQLAQVVADANAWAEKLTTTTALESALSASAPSCSTVEECNTAISNLTTTIANARAAEAPYVEFNRLKAGANSIKDVEYTESGDGAYATFTAVIPAQTTVADNATTAAAVNTAISTLKSAIKTYINNAEPKNEGEFFDVTCLMANPDFSTGDATGWTYGSAPGVNWSNCEYYQTEFDIYQTVTGLPTGSYSLNVQAYQRPGEAGAVYNDYIGGTDNASSVLYINSITSKVKNIAADAQTTQKLGDGNFDWPNDSRVGTEGSYRYLPNSQQGAKLYFDAGLYDATCAAVITDVDEGSLKLGFKSTQTHVDYDWTIFDNFRLRYYGSSLLIYYKQYLPQLKDEAQADLDNATYNFVRGKERPDLTTAIAATPAAETEIAYKAVIDDILEKQAAFQSAKSSYEALDAAKKYAALTEITTNIGDGVFKYPSNTPTLWSTYSSAKSAVDDYTVSNISTAEEVQNMVDALDDAIEAYENITWTTPSSTTRYKLTLAGKGTLTYQTADTDGGYGMPFTPAADYKAQTFFLTPTSGESNYIMSFVDFDGNTRYICDGLASGYTAGTGHYGIRTTTIAEDALSIHIELSTTDDVLYMFNTNVIVDENWKKLGSNGGDFYTDDTYSNWSITEASQASVELSIGAGKLATRIFPFTPTLPEGVEVYTCDATKSETYLALVKEDSPAANIPYILYSENAVESTNITGWGTATTDSYTAGYLTGVLKRTEVPAGSYVLQTQNSKQAFYKVAQAGAYSSPYRVYVTVDSQVKMFNFTLEDIETAIEAARAEGENTVILRYNVAGQQMQNAQKGLNIIKMSDGSVRKVLVK